jgi:hypothetical protein
MSTPHKLFALLAVAGFVSMSAACGSENSSPSPVAPTNIAAGGDASLAVDASHGSDDSTVGSSDDNASGGGGGAIRVRCERRGNSRSKISVDGNNLRNGTYTARVTSGANTATAAAQRSIGDEVEFDFDSNTGEGGTRIPRTFIQGGSVTGEILNAAGNVVRNQTARCEVR